MAKAFISVESPGSFRKTDSFLAKILKLDISSQLHKYGREGVAALSNATPVDSGLAAASWGYEVTRTRGSASITWTNSNIEGGAPVVIYIQYGHGTRNGGYVQGRDFINPALRPIFDRMAENLWKEVTSA